MAKRGQGEGSISKRSDGTWWARITVGKTADGKQKRKAFYGKTRKEVQEKLTAAINDMNNNTYIEPCKITVEHWFDIWVEEYKKPFIRVTTYENYKSIIRAVNQRLEKSRRLDKLTEDEIQKCINLLVEVWTQNRVEKALGLIKVALDQAVHNGLIKKNVAVSCKVPRGKQLKESRALTEQEQIEFVKKASGIKDGEIYIFALGTGMRSGEIRALTWDDVDFEKKLVKVRKNLTYYKDKETQKYAEHVGEPKTKNGTRVIPLTSEMLILLQNIKQKQIINPNNLVFCNSKGNFMDKKNITLRFHKIVKELGIVDVHFHCLRHTFATRCLEKGIELKIIQELLGHSSIKITADIYTHVIQEEKIKAIGKLEGTIVV